MLLEDATDLAHDRPHVARVVEARDERVQALVVEEHLDEQGPEVLPIGHERKETLFLFPEVGHRHFRVEPRESDCLGGRLLSVCGAAQTARRHERVMVIVRERDECRMAFDLATVPAQRFSRPLRPAAGVITRNTLVRAVVAKGLAPRSTTGR